jgi:hypothetical protein
MTLTERIFYFCAGLALGTLLVVLALWITATVLGRHYEERHTSGRTGGGGSASGRF